MKVRTKRKIYLAGPITGLTYEEASRWRWEVDRVLGDYFEIFSPMRDKENLQDAGQLTALGYEDNILTREDVVFQRDRDDVRRSDIVLVNFENAPKISVGTCVEMGWADAWDKPIILVMPEGSIYDHIFTRQISIVRVHTLDEAVQVLRSMV